MNGTISFIDVKDRTVVIRGEMGSKPFPLAGSVAPKAVLQVKGKQAYLSTFSSGEQVVVSWQSKKDGPRIESLKAL
jgi:hypothetical protein